MIKNFHNNVEMLLERMQKVSGQGKHIAMDATVQVCVQLGRVGMKGGGEGEGGSRGFVSQRLCSNFLSYSMLSDTSKDISKGC